MPASPPDQPLPSPRNPAQLAQVAVTIGMLSGRWVLPVLEQLATGPKRHGQLRLGIDGVSEKVLTETLRRMERDGLVGREVWAGRSGHVVYRSTTLAESLDPPLRGLWRWQERNWPEVVRARQRWDSA